LQLLRDKSTQMPKTMSWNAFRTNHGASTTVPDWLTTFDFRMNACEPIAVIELSEQTIIDGVADRLTSKYPTVPPAALTSVVQGVHARFDGRPVREYVPLLVERFAGEELDRLSSTA
jgi:hypothetical protein